MRINNTTTQHIFYIKNKQTKFNQLHFINQQQIKGEMIKKKLLKYIKNIKNLEIRLTK